MHNDDELAHYGVKGMKWGKRKARSIRDDVKTKMSTYDTNRGMIYEAKALRKGATRTEAKAIADKRIERNRKVRKAMLIAGGVSLAAAAAYTGTKKFDRHFRDVNLDTGIKFSNINGVGAGRDLNRHLYVSYKKSDTKKYVGLYGTEHKIMQKRPIRRDGVSDHIYQTTLRSTQKITAPSNTKAKKIFKEVKKNNPELRGVPFRAFYAGLAADAHGGREDFFKTAARKGYNAVQDVNDQKNTAYKSRKPLILLNAAKSTSVDSVRELSDSEIKNTFIKEAGKIVSKKAGKAGLLAAGYVGYTRYSDSAEAKQAVNNYKKKHPGTKMSDAEIHNKLTGKSGVKRVNKRR